MNVEPFALDLATPLETASDTIERREGFLVRVDVDGVEGVGEATPLFPWTETRESCEAALREVAGRDPEAALESLAPRTRPAAAHAVELAVLDARARAADVPLADILADDHAASVPVNATVGDADVEETVAAATDAVDEGFDAVKVKVGARRPAEDVERVRAVREAVGPDVELRADANGAWRGVGEARHALRRLADAGVSYVEQPLPPERLAEHADLRGERVGVALDESLAAHTLEEVLDAEAADVVVLKPMALGGPARAVEVATAARAAGVTPVVTTTVDAVHARTAAVHAAAALGDPPACGLATADLLAEDLGPDPAPVADGRVRVPEGPGNLGGSA